MNDYINYLKNSKCFINLTVSLKQMEEIKASISVFKDIFNSNVSGNVIDEFKDRIDALDKKVDIYISRIKAIIAKLQENASRFDGVLAYWISKKGTDWIPPSKNVIVNKEELIITNYRREVITKVGINENGYIDVEVECFSYDEDYNPETKEIVRHEGRGKTWKHHEIKFNN